MSVTKILSEETRRAFLSRRFIVSLSIGLLISLLQVVVVVLPALSHIGDNIGEYPISLFMMWLGAGGMGSLLHAGLYFFILPIVVMLPHAGSLREDIASGYINHLLVRTDRSHYLRAKFVAAFLSAGTVAVVPLAVNLAITALLVPSLPPQANTGLFPLFSYSMLADLYYLHPYIYTLIYLMIDFLFIGMTTVLALWASYFLSSYFLTVLVPFLTQLFLFMLAEVLNNATIVPFAFLRPDQPVAASPIIIIIELGTLVIVYLYYKILGNRNELL